MFKYSQSSRAEAHVAMVCGCIREVRWTYESQAKTASSHARSTALPSTDIKVDTLACYNIHQNNHSRYHISKLLKNAAWNERLENGGTAQEIRAVIQKIKHQSLARARLTTLDIVSSVYETLRPSIKGGPETHAV